MDSGAVVRKGSEEATSQLKLKDNLSQLEEEQGEELSGGGDSWYQSLGTAKSWMQSGN